MKTVFNGTEFGAQSPRENREAPKLNIVVRRLARRERRANRTI